MGVLNNFETVIIQKKKKDMKMELGCCTVSGDKVMQSINTKRTT